MVVEWGEAEKLAQAEARKMSRKCRWLDYDDLRQEAYVAILTMFRKNKENTKAAVRAALRYSLCSFVYNNLGPLSYKHRPKELKKIIYIRTKKTTTDEESTVSVDRDWERATADPGPTPDEAAHQGRLKKALEEAVRRVRKPADPSVPTLVAAVLRDVPPRELAVIWGRTPAETYSMLGRIVGALKRDREFMAALDELDSWSSTHSLLVVERKVRIG